MERSVLTKTEKNLHHEYVVKVGQMILGRIERPTCRLGGGRSIH